MEMVAVTLVPLAPSLDTPFRHDAGTMLLLFVKLSVVDDDTATSH